MKVNPYNNIKLNFSLDQKEIKLLDKVWEFINDFRETKLTRNKYTKYIIEKIKKKYKINEFYIYENITEKIYWNLVDKIKNDHEIKSEIFFKNINQNIPKNMIKNMIKDVIKETKRKILMRNNKIKESTIKKTFITTSKNILYKYNYPDDLDLIVASVIINRSLYETIMSENKSIFDIDIIIEPYNNIIEFDFPFPNLNTIKPFTKSKKERIINIYNEYYKNLN
jgi:hypothetical protein